MSYDLHVVRTKDWADAATAPITIADVDAVIAADPALGWSTSDYVRMRDDGGVVSTYYMITWNGEPCFWWYKDQITCAGPDENQQRKLVKIARALKAYVVGDEGERYEIQKSFLGREKLVVVPEDHSP